MISQQKAAAAYVSKRLQQELLTVEVPQRKGEVFRADHDEFIKPGTTLETLAKLKPVFKTTNLGTGIRVSAMLHLPGLVLAEQINPIIQSVNKLGLAVRGLYGEGTEALGNVFQVSNQMTLGEPETVIVERLEKVLAQIIEHEENARGSLLDKKPKTVYNQIGRAYGILANARSISSKETMNLLSLMRLGVDLSLFPDLERARAWWDSPEYRAARDLRQSVATARMVALEGVPRGYAP